MLELYLGGARSGKSRLAEQQALASGKQLIYLATAAAGDVEMAARINEHQSRRDHHWKTVEEQYQLADTLLALDDTNHCIVVDCLTLWLSNLLLEPSPERWPAERQRLLSCLPTLKSHVILVSNEVGQGVVPADPLSRRFVDESGFLHQQLAQCCDRVVFTIAGLPQLIKGEWL